MKPSLKRRKKSILIKLLSLTTVVVISICCFAYFKAVVFFDLVSDSIYAWNKVNRVSISNFDTFEINHCDENDKKNNTCDCVLLIHGLGDTAYTWQQTLIEPREGYKKPVHFYALNLPGSLHTPKLDQESSYKPHKLAQNIADSFLPLCSKWVLVGNSYGGWLATIIAQEQPDKIKGMVLTAPAGLKKDYSHILNYFLKPTVEEAKSFYKKTYYAPLDLPDFVFKGIVERSKTLPIISMLKSVEEDDYLDSTLKRNKIPTRLVWGDSDNVILTKWGSEFHSKMNNSSLKIAQNCGHIPQKECFKDFQKELNHALTEIIE